MRVDVGSTSRAMRTKEQGCVDTNMAEPVPADDRRIDTTEHETPALRLVGVSKHFRRRKGGAVTAIDDTSLTVASGEFIVLLGPSGCGKTTLLRCVAGLERPDEGEIEITGRMVFSSITGEFVGPEDRGVSMVFQSYALWPHMSAFQNVAYPLRFGRSASKISKAQVARRVTDVLALVGIPELAAVYPHQMSGGQQQRVALARALVPGSRVILFDEPLSNVDAKVREQLRMEIREMQAKIGFTAVYVTHDQSEAMQLADRVAVIQDGRVQQIGSAQDVYLTPSSRDIANFVGSINEVPGVVVEHADDAYVVETAMGSFVARSAASEHVGVGQHVFVTWRPEKGAVAQAAGGDRSNTWGGVVSSSHFFGAYSEHTMHVGSLLLRQWSTDGRVANVGDEMWLSVDPADVRVFAVEPAGERVADESDGR